MATAHSIIPHGETKSDSAPADPAPTYCASYAACAKHAFIIISKKIELNKESKYLVLASFGLYGAEDDYWAGILFCGAVSEAGKIRSEHYWLFNQTRHPIAAKTFAITAEQANAILEKVNKD